MTTDELVTRIKGNDEAARGQAWQAAGPVGAGAIRPLAEVAAGSEGEIRRAATRAMWEIVRHAGRPGARRERREVVTALLAALDAGSEPRLRSDVIWMLSEVAGRRAVGPLAELLSDKTLREDARMALQRIRGDAARAALRDAYQHASEDFRPNLAYSLRQLGEPMQGAADLRLRPTKPTRVKRAEQQASG